MNKLTKMDKNDDFLKYPLFLALRIRTLINTNTCSSCNKSFTCCSLRGVNDLENHFRDDCPRMLPYKRKIKKVISRAGGEAVVARIEKRLKKEYSHKHRCLSCEKIFLNPSQLKHHKCRYRFTVDIKCRSAPTDARSYKTSFGNKDDHTITVALIEKNKLDKGKTPFIAGYMEHQEELDCPIHAPLGEDCFCRTELSDPYFRPVIVYHRDRRGESYMGSKTCDYSCPYNVIFNCPTTNYGDLPYEDGRLRIQPAWFELKGREFDDFKNIKDDTPRIYTLSPLQKEVGLEIHRSYNKLARV